jgi:hypothetical protein
MSCPTCSYEILAIVAIEPKTYWCPRCGSILTEGLIVECQSPKLVEHCRAFAESVGPTHLPLAWRKLGIADSITPAAERVEVSVTDDNGEVD